MILAGMGRRAALKGSITTAAGVALYHALPVIASQAAGSSALTELTATEALAGIDRRDFTIAAYAEAHLERQAALAELNAFISQDADAVRAAASRADTRLASVETRLPLLGLPVAVKDNIDSADLPTTGGTPALRAWRPAQNAPVMQAVLDAGAILAGKTNLHELAFGITTNNASFGATRNPYDGSLIPGGSSGGTAVAVAARLVPAGLGSDTGGSCRIPAALSGCVGFRPTHGRYDQRGVIPISTTRDTIGPMARSVADIILLDGICAGKPVEIVEKPIEEIRLGVPVRYFYENLDFELEAVVARSLEHFRTAGVQLIDVDVDDVQALNEAISFPIALYEIVRELSIYLYQHGHDMSVIDLVDQVGGTDIKTLLTSLMGDNAVSPGVYQEVMTSGRPALQRAYARYFDDNRLDALVVPTTPLPARPIGQDDTVDLNGEQVPTLMTYIRNTDPPSNAGLPCISVPAGLTATGLPVGVEFVGPVDQDGAVFHIAALFERVTGRLPAPSL